MRNRYIDDYLLRYQVEIDPIGCSTVQWYRQRLPRGSKRERGKFGERGKQAFLWKASSGDVTWANRQSGRSIYIQVWYVHGILPTRYHSSRVLACYCTMVIGQVLEC